MNREECAFVVTANVKEQEPSPSGRISLRENLPPGEGARSAGEGSLEKVRFTTLTRPSATLSRRERAPAPSDRSSLQIHILPNSFTRSEGEGARLGTCHRY